MAVAESTSSGPEYLRRVTQLLQDARRAHPTAGVWEAADLQWWWRKPRSTDSTPQTFWVDDQGSTVAAVILTDWESRLGVDVIVHPSCDSGLIEQLWRHAMADVAAATVVEMMVDDDDTAAKARLQRCGFTDTGERGVSAWLDIDDRPSVSRLAAGHHLHSRATDGDRLHHMVDRNGPDVENRLRETSLYRPALDLFVVDPSGEPVAYGLFWFDPVTGVGLVEPMRTHEQHQRLGLARHILTAGIELLVGAGARRIKINFEPVNAASRTLYLDVGFRPVTTTAVYARHVS
jgi:ribosomal protein S18 acetylase RimI-like enzyme